MHWWSFNSPGSLPNVQCNHVAIEATSQQLDQKGEIDMCLCNRPLDPKTRRLMRIANLALIFGILLWNSERWNWVHGLSLFELSLLHASTGFFFGLCIAIMLFGLLGARRCGNTGSVKL